MRQLIVFCAVLLLAGSAVGQATIVSGWVSNWAPPGSHPVPFVPLVNTPSMTLEGPPLTTGASNGTAGNVAGAVNSTLSIDTNGPGAEYPTRVWYGSPAVEEAAPANGNASVATPRAGQPFEFGIAVFQSSYGVAELMAMSRPRPHAARVYTNPDVAQVNSANGTVKYAGKTEHLD